MASSLASQLRQISTKSTSALNLKAQKASHSKSLIFEPRFAASQTFETLYTLCHEGFQELCLLDGRFLEFQRNIFSEQSQAEDRTQMTADENTELDKRLELFLGLVGGRLRLTPAIKAVEWLVRRFRIHEYNTSFLLTTFLPYHTLPIFTTLLSILPANIPEQYKFLHPYVRSLTAPPRHAVVRAATNNLQFASTLNTYVLQVSKLRQEYPALISFWASIITEATNGILDKARSGRRGVEEQNEQDLLLRLLPLLNEGLAMKRVEGVRLGCYMLLAIMAHKGALGDKLLTAMMEAVVLGWTSESMTPGLLCLSVLAQHRSVTKCPKHVTNELLKIHDLSWQLVGLSKQGRVDKLATGLCLAVIHRLRKNGDVHGLSILERVFENQLLSDTHVVLVFEELLSAARQIVDKTDADERVRSHLAASLSTVTQLPGNVGSVVQRSLKVTNVDIDELEMKLHTIFRHGDLIAPNSQSLAIESAAIPQADTSPSLSKRLALLPKMTTTDLSFLSKDTSQIYVGLCEAFLHSIANATDLNTFDEIPILRRSTALEDALYLSFYMKTWCGRQHPVLARSSALQLVTKYLSSINSSSMDFQAIIPYAIVALGDPATKVRSAATKLLIAMEQLYPSNVESKKSGKQFRTWALHNLYGSGKESQDLKWLSIDVVVRLLRNLLVPALEECVLDKKHIEAVLQNSLTHHTSESPNKSASGHLPQASRASIFAFLASHVIHTPLMSAKLGLLNSLNQIRSVANTSRTKLLLPFFHSWTSLSPSEADRRCKEEHVETGEVDDQAVATVTPNDKEGLLFLNAIVKGEVAVDRDPLVATVFRRLRILWPSLKRELRLQIAETLLESSQSSPDQPNYHEAASVASAEFLRTIPLSTDILLSFLAQLPTAARLADVPPATKRRRTSHGEVARTPLQDSKQLSAAMKQITFVLQLIDNSNPGSHPELLRDLFNILAELQHFKAQVASELAYLQDLVLGSLLAIIQAYKSNLKLDASAVRVDLLVDCVQKTASPQVQNAALMLIASLADTAPGLVLHSVMPIFTFMGSSVLRQNDDYSAHVINQTIRQVIPPLVSSLRNQNGNLVTGAAELLLSFVAAYEHIPPHRRRDLFTSLVQTLGAEDFLFALMAMLVDKYGATQNIQSFAIDLSSSFSVEVQLHSAVKYLELVRDILRPKPTDSAILLTAHEEGTANPYLTALNELMLLPHILSQKRLIAQTAKVLDRDDMDAARIREFYSTLLESLLALADMVKDQKRLQSACGEVLKSILGLLSTSEFVKSIEGLLDRPNESLRRKILRSLEVRVDQESPSDAMSRAAMLAFLPQLTAMIRESTDVQYKRIAVNCVDKISAKYGKKDLEAVSAAAETISSDHCLGQSDGGLRTLALLCLASLVEILKEGIVPVLPIAIPKALDYMESSASDDTDAHRLHNAGYAFITSLVHHLPYMISGGYLDKLLSISNSSAAADLDDDANESRIQCLQFAAKQLDAKTLFDALERNWEKASSAGTSVSPLARILHSVIDLMQALREYLNVLSITIDKHPKSIITKNSPALANIFRDAFDLRRRWTLAASDSFTTNSLSEVEAEVNEIAIKMIYKLNDSTFRPVFENIVEWASSSLPKKDRQGRILRLQSMYAFMAVFFDNLKSIVTSYATYLLDNAVEVLKGVNVKDEESKELWSRVLRALVKCFEHDQDDFWQAPSHFSAICPVLCTQITNAASLPLEQELIPAIVELAAAAESSDHHKELNMAILRHMRSETASVRLAAVKCEQALTNRLGEEWLSLLPEMLPYISELQEDDDDVVERETHRWIGKIENVLGESLDSMLQ